MVVYTDEDVSGVKDPRERPGLSALMDEWQAGDLVIFWKVDRLSRSLLHFVSIMEAAQATKVDLVSVKDPFDLTTASGRMFANMLASFAQFERETIGARIESARAHLRTEGKFAGGRFPYGLALAPHSSGKGKVLVRDDQAASVILEAVQRFLAGEALNGIAMDFNRRGIPSPREHTTAQTGKRAPKPSAWSHSSLRGILRNRHLIGQQADKRGRPVLGDDGEPVQPWPPILDRDVWNLVQDELATREETAVARRVGPRSPRLHALNGVAVCGLCSGNLRAAKSGGREVLRCSPTPKRPDCPGVSIATHRLTPWLDAEVARTFARVHAVERVFVPGNNVAEERADVEHRLDELEQDRKAGMFPTAKAVERYRKQYVALSLRLEELEGAETVEPHWIERPTERTVAELWAEADERGRGDLLQQQGLCVAVYPPPPGERITPPGKRCRVQPAGDPLAEAEREARYQAES